MDEQDAEWLDAYVMLISIDAGDLCLTLRPPNGKYSVVLFFDCGLKARKGEFG